MDAEMAVLRSPKCFLNKKLKNLASLNINRRLGMPGLNWKRAGKLSRVAHEQQHSAYRLGRLSGPAKRASESQIARCWKSAMSGIGSRSWPKVSRSWDALLLFC